MDTYVSIEIQGKEGEKALEACWKKLEDLSIKFDRFNSESEIYKINSNSGNWVKISNDTLDLLKKAIHFAKVSEGLFDPTIAPIMKIWGFYDKNYKIPNIKEIKDNLKKVDYKKINIEDSKVYIGKGMELDFGGIAKGYILDKLFEVLRDYKIERAILNLGGQIGVYGKPLEGNSWKIKIRHPRDLDNYIGIVYIGEGSIATSGDYERYFVKDDKRYCHIMDPRTGYPASEIMSVSVIAKSATEADAMSKVFFILGKNSLKIWRDRFSHLGVIIIFKDGSVWYSPNIHFIKNEDR